MKNKKNKVFKIIVFSLLGACCIAYLVLYCVFPQTKDITWQAFDYICNKPLPVIGISISFALIILYKIIRFVVRHRTEKVADLNVKIASLKEMILAAEQENELFKQTILKLISESEEKAKAICSAIPNKQVQSLGEKLYGNQNSQSKTEEI